MRDQACTYKQVGQRRSLTKEGRDRTRPSPKWSTPGRGDGGFRGPTAGGSLDCTEIARSA